LRNAAAHRTLFALSTVAAQSDIPSPLGLLLRVNVLTAWRRFKALGEHSRLLTAVIITFIGSYLILAYWLFFFSLKYIILKFPGLGPFLVERLLFLLFAFLFVLLLLSNLVISYSNLFRNRETAFLLSLPIPTRTIFQWKFLESTLLASWAFLFLIAPFLAAYGWIRGVPWHFYFVTTLLVGLFIVLPAVAGSWLAVNVARFLDRKAFQILALLTMFGIIFLCTLWFRPEPLSSDATGTRVLETLDKLLLRTRFAHYPLLPSYWLSASVLQWADGAKMAASFFVLVLLSYVLFFGALAFTRMGNVFYDAASAVNSRASVFGRWNWFRARQSRKMEGLYSLGFAEGLVRRFNFLRSDVRGLLVKDFRMFWRDTTQWAQSFMLFGLLGVYIFNLRHFSQQIDHPFWVHLISYLNLGACSLNLATLTTRFVYPQFSLEGKRLWIVGMAPLGLARIIRVKFWLAATMSWIVTLLLIALSCHMLDMSWDRTLHFIIAVTIMTFTLTGLAIGLGVLYPNFKEENPSKIVSGFGGTFCLVLSFLYILGSVVLLAFSSQWMGAADPSRRQLIACIAGFGLLSFLVGWLPYYLGLRRVKHFEL
jgi:ABC-2 type transport system permease protein